MTPTKKGIVYGIVGTLAGWFVGGFAPVSTDHPLLAAMEEVPQPTYGMPVELPKRLLHKTLALEGVLRLSFDSNNDGVADYEQDHTILFSDGSSLDINLHPRAYRFDANNNGLYDCLEIVIDEYEDGLNDNERVGDCTITKVVRERKII